jgi:hypothetical protein
MSEPEAPVTLVEQRAWEVYRRLYAGADAAYLTKRSDYTAESMAKQIAAESFEAAAAFAREAAGRDEKGERRT